MEARRWAGLDFACTPDELKRYHAGLPFPKLAWDEDRLLGPPLTEWRTLAQMLDAGETTEDDVRRVLLGWG